MGRQILVDPLSTNATPKLWSLFINCKMAINLMSGNSPLGIKLRAKSYINDRKPGRATIMDSSRWKIGRFSLSNRLLCLKRVNFDWCHGLSSDNLRINLKKCFIPVFQDFFVTFDIMISFLSLLTESYIVFYWNWKACLKSLTQPKMETNLGSDSGLFGVCLWDCMISSSLGMINLLMVWWILRAFLSQEGLAFHWDILFAHG